jgi:acylphosphatase
VSPDVLRCLRVTVSGHVQGVCFRHYTRLKANELGITGWVRNLSNGDVEALICGSSEQTDAMLAWLAVGPEHARVNSCHAKLSDVSQPPANFVILN